MCVHTLTEPVPGIGYCDELIDNCDYVDIVEKTIQPTNNSLFCNLTLEVS